MDIVLYLSGLRFYGKKYIERYERYEELMQRLYSPSRASMSEVALTTPQHKDTSDRLVAAMSMKNEIFNDIANDLKRYNRIVSHIERMDLTPTELEIIFLRFQDDMLFIDISKEIRMSYSQTLRLYNGAMNVVRKYFENAEIST